MMDQAISLYILLPSKVAHVNVDVCRSYLTRLHDIGVENKTFIDGLLVKEHDRNKRPVCKACIKSKKRALQA